MNALVWVLEGNKLVPEQRTMECPHTDIDGDNDAKMTEEDLQFYLLVPNISAAITPLFFLLFTIMFNFIKLTGWYG